MTLGFEELLNIVEHQKLKWIEVTDLSDNRFCILDGNVSDELRALRNKFPSMQWKLNCRTSSNNSSTQRTYYADFGSEKAPKVQMPDVDKIKSEIREEIKQQMELEARERQREQELREKDEEIAQLKTPMGKVSMVLEGVVTQLVSKINLDGLMKTGNLQGTPETEEPLTNEELALNKAVEVFDSCGVDGFFLLKLANAVKKDPSLIKKVKLFLNI